MLENTFGSVRYTALPSWFMFSSDTDAHANIFIRLYTYLNDRAKLTATEIYNTELLSQQELADKLNCSRMSISRNLNKLKESRLIEIINKPGQKSEYKILDITKSKLTEKAQNTDLLKPYKNIKSKVNAVINSAKENLRKEKINLTEEQRILKHYIENKTRDKLTNKKVIILWDAAINNQHISNNSLAEKIKLIVDSVTTSNKNIRNYFGYIKRSIINFREPEGINENEYLDMAVSLQLKLESEYPKEYHFSVKQCNALFSIIDKKIMHSHKSSKSIDQFLISEVINKSRSVTGIKDMFRYMIQIINNYGTEQPDLKNKKCRCEHTEQSYDIKEFESFAVTFSGNTLGTGIPKGFNNSEPSYDIDEFEKFAITHSRNTSKKPADIDVRTATNRLTSENMDL